MDKEKSAVQKEMFDYIRDNEIYYIADLWNYAEKERADDWFPVLRSRQTYKSMKILLESRRRVARKDKKVVPPPKNSWHKDISEEGENING